MAFETVADLDCDTTIQLGGINKETAKPNPKTVEGYYLGAKMTEGKYGPSALHIFKTAKGNIGVWGKTDLDAKLAGVTPGTMVQATFDRTVPSNKGNDKWKYIVKFDKNNTIAVASAQEETTEGYEDVGAVDEAEETGFDADDTQVEDPAPLPPRRPQTAAKPNPGKAANLLGGRKTA